MKIVIDVPDDLAAAIEERLPAMLRDPGHIDAPLPEMTLQRLALLGLQAAWLSAYERGSFPGAQMERILAYWGYRWY